MKRNTFLKKVSSLLGVGTMLLALSSCLASGSESFILEEDIVDPGEGISDVINFDGQEATYSSGDMPATTVDIPLDEVTMNQQALSGGANFITIRTKEDYDVFYVGLKGMNGYYTVAPKTKSYDSQANQYIYTMVMNFSEEFSETVTVIIRGGNTETGDVSKPYESDVEFVESRTGDLDIKLVFENAKDIDLHLITPSGLRIYYGNRGGEYTDENGEQHSYGLDHDSNASCRIDNLNNENIFLPNAMLEAGTYTVQVDMFSNCDRSISTAWSLWVRYQGDLIRNELADYGNPAQGVYPVGAGTGDHTPVFQFTLTSVQAAAARARSPKLYNIRPILPTDMDLIKMEQEAIDATL